MSMVNEIDSIYKVAKAISKKYKIKLALALRMMTVRQLAGIHTALDQLAFPVEQKAED